MMVGQGYSYKCEKCKNKYYAIMGSGMMHPKIYTQIINSISNGEYGQEWKKLFESQKYTAVNAKKTVYICKTCGNWETDYVLDLYVPINPKEISNTQYRDKTIAEWGYVPYAMGYELKYDYRVLKHFIHRCSNCGKRTHKASNSELKNLSCPKCGKANQSDGIIFWD